MLRVDSYSDVTFKSQEITIMMKSKIKRRKGAKHSLNSMAVGPGYSGGGGIERQVAAPTLHSNDSIDPVSFDLDLCYR